MNTNQRAIECLERNEYDDALKLFKNAVEESRNIQSLTNLAWIYLHEECDKEIALKLIEEAIEMNPTSHFPYNLSGEIYMEKEQWQLASDALLHSIIILPSDEAHNNLAVANYHLGQVQEASDYFLLCSKRSDYAMYSHVKCLIELGRKEEAKIRLDNFSENDDDFVGTVEIAELFLELGYFKESVQWFEKGWESYWKTPDWVSRYVYGLFKIKEPNRARDILKEVIQQLLDEKSEYEMMYERISSGYIPSMKYNTSMSTSCYLFGCKRHNHPEYSE